MAETTQTTFWRRYEMHILFGAFFIGLAMIVFGAIERQYWEIGTAGWFLMPLATGYILGRLS